MPQQQCRGKMPQITEVPEATLNLLADQFDPPAKCLPPGNYLCLRSLASGIRKKQVIAYFFEISLSQPMTGRYMHGH